MQCLEYSRISVNRLYDSAGVNERKNERTSERLNTHTKKHTDANTSWQAGRQTKAPQVALPFSSKPIPSSSDFGSRYRLQQTSCCSDVNEKDDEDDDDGDDDDDNDDNGERTSTSYNTQPVADGSCRSLVE